MTAGSYIQQLGYTDIQSLHTAYMDSAKDLNKIIRQQPEVKKELKNLRELKNQVEIYRKTADNFKKYNAPRQLAYFKNQFFEKHKADIEAHKIAREYIYDELKLTKFPSLKQLNENISKLAEAEKQLREELPTAREKYDALRISTHNARMLLGYKNLEQRNIEPIAGILRFGQTQSYAVKLMAKSYHMRTIRRLRN